MGVLYCPRDRQRGDSVARGDAKTRSCVIFTRGASGRVPSESAWGKSEKTKLRSCARSTSDSADRHVRGCVHRTAWNAEAVRTRRGHIRESNDNFAIVSGRAFTLERAKLGGTKLQLCNMSMKLTLLRVLGSGFVCREVGGRRSSCGG
eukprot:6176002-Pleurochrysis_carterae.AAC.2